MGEFVFQMGAFIFKWGGRPMGGALVLVGGGFSKKIIRWGVPPHVPPDYGKPWWGAVPHGGGIGFDGGSFRKKS